MVVQLHNALILLLAGPFTECSRCYQCTAYKPRPTYRSSANTSRTRQTSWVSPGAFLAGEVSVGQAGDRDLIPRGNPQPRRLQCLWINTPGLCPSVGQLPIPSHVLICKDFRGMKPQSTMGKNYFYLYVYLLFSLPCLTCSLPHPAS